MQLLFYVYFISNMINFILIKSYSIKYPCKQYITRYNKHYLHSITQNNLFDLSYEIIEPSISTLLHQSPLDKRTIVFLHGILGSKSNWKTPAKTFIQKYPQYQSIIIDHRHHGKSTHYPIDYNANENTIINCAKDLHNLFINTLQMNSPNVLIAHSFGGKVALQYLFDLENYNQNAKIPIELPQDIWIVDSIPGLYASSSYVHYVFDTLLQIPSEFESKEWLIQEICSKKIDKAIAQWIAMNIQPSTKNKGEYMWSFNIHEIKQLFDHFCQYNMFPLLENYHGKTNIHFIRAGKNNLWTQDEQILQNFTQLCQKNKHIFLHEMKHVGHNVHVDDLTGMIELISKYV